MARRALRCQTCATMLGTIRPGTHGEWLDVSNNEIVQWWDTETGQHVIACPCGEWTYWRGDVKWRQAA